jgi:hypothetical protein
MNKIADTYMAYQFIKRLNTPFIHWDAYKLGVIDEDGNVLVKRSKLTREQLDAWGRFDVLVANLKRLLARLPGGNTKLATIAATVLLLKEENLDENDVDLLAEQLDNHIVEMKKEMETLPTESLTEQFRIIGKTDVPEGTGVPHKVEKWHQSRQNGWCVQVMDKHDNQVGEAEYHYHKADAERARRQLAKHHGINESETNLLEDAAVNAVGGGHIAGIGVGPDGEPGKSTSKRKKKKGELPSTNLFTRKSNILG